MSVANWSKTDLLLIFVPFDSTWWHFITADLPMNLQVRLYLCSSCSSWVMLQIVLKRKFFIKRLPSHQLPYIKLLFKLHALYYTDQSFQGERPLGVSSTLREVEIGWWSFRTPSKWHLQMKLNVLAFQTSANDIFTPVTLERVKSKLQQIISSDQ